MSMKKLLKNITLGILTLCAGLLIGLGAGKVDVVKTAHAANVNTTVTEDNFLVRAASLRIVDEKYQAAVRFKIVMEKETFDNNYVTDGELNSGLTTGLLLATKSALGNNDLTEANKAISATTTENWYPVTYDGVEYMESAVFVYNIPKSAYATNLIVRAYVKYNGVTTYSVQTGGVSLSWVANQTYADKLGDNGMFDESDGLTEQEKSVRENYCKYELNYYVDDAVSSSGSAYYGEKLTAPSNPTSSSVGEFLGWYNRTGTVKWEFATQTALGATNLFAKFALENPYNVTFDLQSTTTEPAYLANEYKTDTGYATEYKGVALKLPTPERYGYRFLGWYNAATGGSKVSDTFSCSNDTTLYARWSSTCYLWLYYGERSTDYVRFEYQVGDVVSIEDLNKLYPEALTLNTTKLGLPYVANIEYWAYENDTINETYSKIESDITFYQDKSEVIVIARYNNYLTHLEYTQESKDDYLADGDFDTAPSYITTGKVEHVFVDKDAVAGTYSMTLSWVKGQVTSGSFGPAFRMDPIAHDYQYETKGAACSNYLSVVVGPTTGNTGIYRVVDGKWSRVCDDLAVSGDWKTYYTSVQNGATITLTMQIVVSANGFDVVYKFNDKTQSIYSTTMDLTPYLGTGFGLRSSSTGVTVSNVTYEPSYVKVVQFYSQDTLLSTQYTAPDGGTVAFPATPTKAGYTKYNGNVVSYEFIGWYTENNEKVTEARKFIRDTKLTARFKPVERRNDVLVSYDNQGDVIYTVDSNRVPDVKEGITFDGYGLPLTTAGNEVSYKLTVPKLNKSGTGCNVRFTFFIDDIETSGNKSLDIDGENGQNTVWVNLALTTGVLILGSKINGSSKNNYEIRYTETTGNYVWADRTTGNASASKNNKFIEYYKNIVAAGTSEAVFDVKAKYGIDANGYGWIKFYMFDQLIFTYGLSEDSTAGYVGGEKVWGRICTDSNYNVDNTAFLSYMKGKALGTEIGIWSWAAESAHGGYSISDIYATRIKNGITVTKDTNGNDVWSVTGDRSTLQGVIIGEGYENGVFEHRLSVDDMPAGESAKNYRTLFFAEEGTSASFTGNGTQASLWVNFHVGNGALHFGSKIYGKTANNYALSFNSINPESSFKKYYDAKSKAAKASSEPVAAAFDIKVVYGLDENGHGWVKYYMKGGTDSVYSLLFTYGLTKADLNGEVCHGKMCTDVNYSTDNSVFLSYVKGGKMGTKVGFCSWAGTPNFEYTVSNVSITELKTQDNGFTIRKDGSYVAQASTNNIVTVQDMIGNDGNLTKYGTWEVDVTMDKVAIQSERTGIILRAYVPKADGVVSWSDPSVNAYYLHHNAKANVNFTLVGLKDGVYTGNNLKFLRYAPDDWSTFNLTEGNAAYADVLKYYEDNQKVQAGILESVTIRMGIRLTPTRISVLINGNEYSYSTTPEVLTRYDDNDACVQVGFVSGAEGTIFSNYRFTPYTENA